MIWQYGAMSKIGSNKASDNAGAARSKKRTPAKAAAKRGAVPKPRLLSGDNPQIAKGYGDAPVQAYMEAIPGWKQDVALRLDALIAQTIPGVRKAVKYNSPLYGAPDAEDWFLSLHCFTKYVKVSFFRGAALRPPPPGPSKMPETRYLDIREDDVIDEGQFVKWVKQASRLPGERL